MKGVWAMGYSSQGQYNTIVMPFGKWKHRPLTEVPYDYLCWLLGEVDLRPALEVALRAELDRRNGTQRQAPPPIHKLPAGVTLTDALELIGAGRRSLAKRHHPDR